MAISPKPPHLKGNWGRGTHVTMVMLNLKLEVEIWQFRTRSMKITQYNTY